MCLLGMTAGVPHTLWNADNTTTLTYEITLQPCPGSERLYENVAALAEMAGSLERINPLQLLVTMHHFHVSACLGGGGARQWAGSHHVRARVRTSAQRALWPSSALDP